MGCIVCTATGSTTAKVKPSAAFSWCKNPDAIQIAMTQDPTGGAGHCSTLSRARLISWRLVVLVELALLQLRLLIDALPLEGLPLRQLLLPQRVLVLLQ